MGNCQCVAFGGVHWITRAFASFTSSVLLDIRRGVSLGIGTESGVLLHSNQHLLVKVIRDNSVTATRKFPIDVKCKNVRCRSEVQLEQESDIQHAHPQPMDPDPQDGYSYWQCPVCKQHNKLPKSLS